MDLISVRFEDQGPVCFNSRAAGLRDRLKLGSDYLVYAGKWTGRKKRAQSLHSATFPPRGHMSFPPLSACLWTFTVIAEPVLSPSSCTHMCLASHMCRVSVTPGLWSIQGRKDIQASVGILISGVKSHMPKILLTVGAFISKCLPL